MACMITGRLILAKLEGQDPQHSPRRQVKWKDAEIMNNSQQAAAGGRYFIGALYAPQIH